MHLQLLNYSLALLCLTLVITACNRLVPTPEPDRIATEVAVQRTAAAILTAEATTATPTLTPASVEPTSPPSPATDTPTLTPTNDNTPSTTATATVAPAP